MWTTLKGGILYRVEEFVSDCNREQFRYDFPGSCAIPVGRESLPIHRRIFANCCADRVGIWCNEPVSPRLHGFHPLRAVSQSNARHSEIKRFLLNATGVRQDFPRMLLEGE